MSGSKLPFVSGAFSLCGLIWAHSTSLSSHYFHIEDGHQPNSRGLYSIPIIRIPSKGGMTIPNIGSLDPGSFEIVLVRRFPKTRLSHKSH